MSASLHYDTLLGSTQTWLLFLSWIYTFLLSAWALVALLRDFSHGLLHVAPLALELLALASVFSALTLGVVSRGAQLRTDTRNKLVATLAARILVILSIALNVVHIVFGIIEAVDCATVFCMGTQWFLIVFVIVLGILVVLKGFLVYYLILFNSYAQGMYQFLKNP